MTGRDQIHPAPSPATPIGRLHQVGFAVSLFAVAALVRAAPYRFVFTPEGVFFKDGDSYAHMSRIWSSASRSAPLSARDPFANFPHGGEAPWPPGFDWIVAGGIRGLGLEHSTAEIVCAWLPLVLGASVVVLAALIAARTFSRLAGWSTGLILAVLPASYQYTQLGFLDHHAATALVGTLLLGGSMQIVSRGGAGPAHWFLPAGLLGGLASLLWPGALLHVGVLQVAMLTWALGASSRELAIARTTQLALAQLVTAIVILPFSLNSWVVFGDFSPLVLTRFQPTWYAACGVSLGAVLTLWRSPALGRTRPSRWLSLSAVGAIGLALAFVAIPELAAALDRSAGWFTGEEEFIANISETAPLFSGGDMPMWFRPTILLSPLLFVFPFAMLMIARERARPETLVLLFWTAAFLALTLVQIRFINSFSVAYSIVFGGAIASLLRRLAGRIERPPLRIAAQSLGLLTIAAMLLGVSGYYYRYELLWADTNVFNIDRKPRVEVARFLARESPPALDANGEPTSGVLCAWMAGHEVRYYSGWAVHQDGFGPYGSPEGVELAERYYGARTEAEAVEVLERLGTRYVVAEILGGGHPPYPSDSMARRLVELRGSRGVVRSGAFASKSVPALARHRLVFFAPSERGGASLYELVPGAVVEGVAAPGSLVTVEIRLRSGSGDERSWSSRQSADETGRFQIRVPYATRPMPASDIEPLGPYRLHTNRGFSRFDVSEESIRGGETLVLPSSE